MSCDFSKPIKFLNFRVELSTYATQQSFIRSCPLYKFKQVTRTHSAINIEAEYFPFKLLIFESSFLLSFIKLPKWPLISTFSGKNADYLRDNLEEIKSEYDFELKVKPDCVQISVLPGKFLNSSNFEADSKYKIFLKTEVNTETRQTTFFLTRSEVTETKTVPVDHDFLSPKNFLR